MTGSRKIDAFLILFAFCSARYFSGGGETFFLLVSGQSAFDCLFTFQNVQMMEALELNEA